MMELDRLYPKVAQECADKSFIPIGSVVSEFFVECGDLDEPDVCSFWEYDGGYYGWYHTKERDVLGEGGTPWLMGEHYLEWFKRTILPQIDPYKTNMELEID